MKKEILQDRLSIEMERYDLSSYAASIRSVVPGIYFTDAASIVEQHRPSNLPKGFNPLFMALSESDYELLNENLDPKSTIYEDMRTKYCGDKSALNHINKMDPASDYSAHIRALDDAYQYSNNAEIERLRQWFKKYDEQHNY